MFDKPEADLAKAMMSLPATKGFEVGSGSTASTPPAPSTTTSSTWTRRRTAHAHEPAGGIQGGISNGEIIELKIAFKPTSTITRPQNTVNRDGVDVELKAGQARPLRGAPALCRWWRAWWRSCWWTTS